MTKDEAIGKLERVSEWINQFPVPTDGATAMIFHLRKVREFLAIEAAPSEAVAWQCRHRSSLGWKWSEWRDCDKEQYLLVTRSGGDDGLQEVRELFIAAQPAADPAPVPAQGIDHAKRAEGEREAFEEFAKGARFFELERTRDGAYAFAATRCAWMAWQARGQQAGVCTDQILKIIGYAYQVAGAHDAPDHILDVLADPEEATDEQVEAMLPYEVQGQQAGVPEGCVIVPKEPTEAMIRAACVAQTVGKQYDSYDAWWNDHSSGISERIRNYIASDYRVMIAAAAPGEAG